MVNAKELVERFGGAPQVLPKTQDELRREVERLRIEVELAQRGGLGEDEHLTVDMVLPPEAIVHGFTSPEDFVVKESSLQYTDGSSYQGEVLGGLRHGKGAYKRADGTLYEGDWRYDALDGRGKAVLPFGQTYEGEWRGGRAEGHGVACYENGAVYDGDFVADGRHGWGEQVFPSGDKYEGEWAADKIHGKGRWTYPDGSHYEGEWQEGLKTHGRQVSADGGEEYSGQWQDELRHGEGVAYVRAGYKYAGGWAKGEREGRGRCVYADGSVYDGDWLAGLRHGHGKLATSGGYKYEGGWQEDRQQGEGASMDESGDRYIGQFAKGLRHGRGRCLYADGSRYDGEWQEGLRCGAGVCSFANGDVYKGEWQGDKRHGRGACRFADGSRFKGEWEGDGWVQSGAEPQRCRVAGPGVTRAVAGREAHFIIQARDEDGNRRLNGGDEFQVALTLQSETSHSSTRPGPFSAGSGAVPHPGEEEAAEGAPETGGELAEFAPPEAAPVTVPATVEDKGDGTYGVSYLAAVAGVYAVSITMGGDEHVADSPYPLRVLPSKPCLKRCTVEGPGRGAAVPGTMAHFQVVVLDEFGNPCSGEGLQEHFQVEATLEGPGMDSVPVEVQPTRDGRFVCSYVAPMQAGYYRLHVDSKGVPLPGTPHSVHVREPAPAGTAASDKHGVSVHAVEVNETAKEGRSDAAEETMRGGGGLDAPAWRDESRVWEQIAAAAYAADGVMNGWDSEDEGKSRDKPSAEDSYLAAHPGVPVVESLEDIWLVSKLQGERKAKEEKQKSERLQAMRARLEETFGPGQAPGEGEVQAAVREILAEEVKRAQHAPATPEAGEPAPGGRNNEMFSGVAGRSAGELEALVGELDELA